MSLGNRNAPVDTPVADKHCQAYQDEGADRESSIAGTDDIRRIEREHAEMLALLQYVEQCCDLGPTMNRKLVGLLARIES
jgi:hypothetical protein